jgi:hypothetical protein
VMLETPSESPIKLAMEICTQAHPYHQS